MDTSNLTVQIPAETTGAESPASKAEENERQVQAQADASGSEPLSEKAAPDELASPESDAANERTEDKQAPESREAAETTLKDKGLNIADFEAEFTASGTLSEDSYKKLMDAGIPRNMVDSYIAGQQALVQTFVSDIYGIAGGQEQYGEMIQWAKGNLSPSEIAAFDRIANAGQKDMLELAVTGLVSRWRMSEGQEPELTPGRASASRGGARDIFESSAQVVEAMKDKRYGKDPAYTHAVEQKLARSKVFG